MLEKHVFCVKCHAGKTVVNQSPVVMKNGATALKGKCPSCDSTTYKIVNREALRNKRPVARPSRDSSHNVALALFSFALGLAAGSVLSLIL